jgi:hypothetical protein
VPLTGSAAVPVARTDPALSPLISVVPGQLFARDLSLTKGYDPDRPARLTKITRVPWRVKGSESQPRCITDLRQRRVDQDLPLLAGLGQLLDERWDVLEARDPPDEGLGLDGARGQQPLRLFERIRRAA